jgi:hypothetical protein
VTSIFIARLSAIVLAVIIGAASASAVAYARQPTPVPAATLVPAPALAELDTRDADARLETDPFIRTELFFGSERSGKPEVSDSEFKQFLDAQITPRFPDGLTVLKGFGQFRESDGDIVQESSFVLILLYPRETLHESSAKIEEIRMLYKYQFEQESVLRVDDPRVVRVSF